MALSGGGREGLPYAHEELMQPEMPTAEANRLAVRASLQTVLEVSFERWGSCWICTIVLLVLGMIGVLIWSEWIYDQHRDDACDQPLAMMLRVLYVIAAVLALQREIIRHVLCYNMLRDGPEEPFRVKIFRRGTLIAMVFWPIVGAIMLSKVHKCSSPLINAVSVITAYYIVVAVVAIIMPAFLISVMLCLIRRGFIRAPRSRHAAPEGLIDQLPQVQFVQELFDDTNYPVACPICLDAFDAERPITRTVCAKTPNGHAFHTDCLQGWLRCARTCPLCRQDLTEPGGGPDETVGMQLAPV